jgi:hypothetical protein
MSPLCRRLYPGNNYILQQDGATSHTCRVTIEHLREETPEFIKKDECPPQPHDLNPMDLTMWDSLSEKVYAGRTDKFTEQELEIYLAEIRKSI